MTPDYIKAGADCVTRDGRRASIEKVDKVYVSWPVLGNVDGKAQSWNECGFYLVPEWPRGLDLVGPWVEPKAGDA